MCYVIAKHIKQIGCIAFKTSQGKHLVELKQKMIGQIGCDEVELITISRPSAYGEYAPYTFVETEEAFIAAAIELNRMNQE